MMDLHEFSGGEMYFNEQIDTQVSTLLEKSASAYGSKRSEVCLIKAIALAPQSLTVQVALYRFYYYQHRYQDALDVAMESMKQTADLLEFKVGWELLDINILGIGVFKSMTLVRFYLLALKGAGYLNLRLGNLDEGVAMLNKVASLDKHDRLGSSSLLQVVERYRRAANFGALSLVSSGSAMSQN